MSHIATLPQIETAMTADIREALPERHEEGVVEGYRTERRLQLLNNLRGDLVRAVSSDDFVLVAAHLFPQNFNARVFEQIERTGDKGAERVATATQTLALKVIEAAFADLSHHIEAGYLLRDQVSLERVLGTKHTKALLREFARESLAATEAQVPNVVGGLRGLLEVAIGTALAVHGRSGAKPHHQRAGAFVSLGFEFLDPKLSGELATATNGLPWVTAAEYLLQINALPKLPLSHAQNNIAPDLRMRLQKDLAGLAVTFPSDLASGALSKLVELYADIFSQQEAQLYLYRTGSDRPLMLKLLHGIRTQELVIRAVTCPDFSGEIVAGDRGEKQWKYDFKELGVGPGIVAYKGIPFVAAFYAAVRPYIANVSIEHFGPSFEIRDGFVSKKEGVPPIGYAEARARLLQSGESISALYAQRGLQITTGLTGDRIGESAFTEQVTAHEQVLLSALGADPELQSLVDFIRQNRSSLYKAWFVRDEGEADSTYEARIKRAIVHQMAEYITFGSLLTADESAVLLSYDSPYIGEAFTLRGLPVLFGVGKDSMNYMGA